MKTTNHHIVVVGGGFGGLQCVKALRAPGARITLIDQRNYHLFQPLLYQLATTILPASEIAWPLRHVFRDRQDVFTVMAEVIGVDPEARVVLLGNGGRITYDTLVLATGARHSYFGHDSWEAHAPGLKSLDDATAIRRRILSAFELAECTDDPRIRDALTTFVVIGAGPTGVELAGAIVELARRVLPREFRRIDTRTSRVILVEAGPRVLGAFPEGLSRYAANALRRLGVEVRTGTPVTSCDQASVVIGTETVPARTILWAAGVQASNAADWIGAATDRAGRAVVAPDLSVPGRPEVFVVGDTAAVTDSTGAPVVGTAPAAKQMGAYVARVIGARLKGSARPAPFSYRDVGNLATIGHRSAIADFGWVRLKGSVAWWAWGLAHIYFLIGTRSRFAVVWSWLWSYLTGQKSARLITGGP